jgi:all-trans-retinol 13,14-reductase
MKQKQTIIIIGGGISGLFCGAILSKEGYSVKIFEQHYKIGGGLHQFKREGVSFETGMHLIGEFQPGGVLNRICSYLGVMDKLSILPGDENCSKLFHIISDQKKYIIPKGHERFIESLSKEFPEEKENIKRYVETVYSICKEVKLYNLEIPSFSLFNHSVHFTKSVGEFIDSFTDNERLRSVLAIDNPLYAGDRYKTPAYIHALINKLYIENTARFIGGSQQLADALVEVITRTGSEVYTAKGVTHIEIEEKKIAYLLTSDGEKQQADYYISSIHPSSLFELLDTSKIQRSYWQRIDSIPNTYSAFTLYILFKPDTFPFFNYTYYYMEDYSMTWEQNVYTADSWPKGLMFITPPVTGQGAFAEKMIVNCIMNFETVKPWENTTSGKRGKDYEAFKRRCEQQIIGRLEEIYPDIRTCIQSVYSASPLTIRDYGKQKEGALYGVKKDCTNEAMSHIYVRTKLKNLLLTGQNISLHGILGVPLTAITTCAELLGMEYLLNEINKNK